MSQYGMVIDLNKCTGCGACAIACKAENNTQTSTNSQTFNWADYYISYEGTFPNIKYQFLPVLCNHCSNAPCVEVCPVEPKAMFKSNEGITLHNDERCIGCRRCMDACPYSVRSMQNEDVQYSVISYNSENVHDFWKNRKQVIANCTSSANEISKITGSIPPNANLYEHPDYEPIRREYVVEKCILCDHRRRIGLQPFCVVSCPAGARIFGDFDDKESEVSKLIKNNPFKRLKNNRGEFLGDSEEGTKPNVYYIGEFTKSKL